MKFFTIILLATVFALNAQASLSTTSCNNGYLSGDRYMQIDINSNSINFSPYEASFSVDFVDVIISVGAESRTYTILNQFVEGSVEGQSYTATYNIIMTWSADNTKLNIAYSSNFGPFQSLEMTCQEIAPVLD